MENLNVNYERFPPEYFSGSNIHIFFDDIYIDEIINMQFSMREKVQPVYGYNSYTYDDMLRGNRIVQGAFRINFKKVNYIRSAIESIMDSGRDASENFPGVNPGDIEAKKNKLYQYSKEGWSSQFEELSEEFKKAIWLNSENTSAYINNNTPSFDFGGEFNIIIKYGPYDKPRPRYTNEILYRENVSNGTIIKLEDVNLTSVSQTIEPSGRPVGEDYSFIAKDISREQNINT